jgi:glycosyltransferase involved in cell wall biosynthesis
MGTRPALNALAAGLARPGLTVVGQEHINLGTHRAVLREEIAHAYRKLDVLVTLVEGDRKEYDALLGEFVRVERIPNAVPVLPGAPAALDAPTLVAVGRLTRQKGFDLLIPAFAEVVRTHPDWTLRICGGGAERGRLERQIAQHQLHNHVLLLGPVGHVEEQLARSSVFVMSSRFEGLPMALIEAMSKGLPVVSFDCPTGPADVIEPGRSGLLVPDGDIHELARGMLTLIEDEALRRELGRGAIARAADFSMEAIGPRWDALLQAARAS